MPRIPKSLLAGLVLLPTLALPLSTSDAVAQEAITLESIGAVRMAPPEEAQRRASADTVRRAPIQAAGNVVPGQRADAAN